MVSRKKNNITIKSLLVILIFSSVAISSQDGPRCGITFTNVYNPGSVASWTNLNNLLYEDGLTASSSILSGNNKYTDYLYITNFGFILPGTARVDGILVEIKISGVEGTSRDHTIQLLKNGNRVGTNKARFSTAWPVSLTFISFGSSTDLWGASWNQSDINSTNFGIAISVKNKKKRGNPVATPRIDYVRISVFFNQNFYYSKSIGELDLLSSWGSNTDGSGSPPPNFTAEGQIFTVRNRSSATIGSNWIISGSGSKLIIGENISTVNFIIPANYCYTGIIDVTNNATLTNTNSTVPTFGTLENGSMVFFNAAGNQTIPDITYYNLTLSGSGTKTVSAGSSFAVNGNLLINSGTELNNNGNTLILNGNMENNGITSGIGILWICGDVSQTISGTGGVIGNADLDNAMGITLMSSQNSNGALILSDGIFNVNSFLSLNTLSEITRDNGEMSGTLQGTDSYDVTYIGSSKTTSSELSGSGLRELTVNLNSGQTLTLGSAISLQGGLTISSGILDVSDHNYGINLMGNYTNNSSFVQRYGNVSFNGYSSQSIGGSMLTNFNDLTINNSSGNVQLTVSVQVNNLLSLTSGCLMLGNNNITLGSSGSITGYSSAYFIITDSSGSLKRNNVSSSNVIFPVGNITYTPVLINNSGITDNFSVCVKNTIDNPIGSKIVRKQWKIEEEVTGGSNAAITLQWNQADEDPAFLRNEPVFIGRHNGVLWELNGPYPFMGPDPFTITGTGFTQFSPFVVGNQEALPVSLVYFGFDVFQRDVILKWTTDWEMNNKGFCVERLESGSNKWIEIGFVNGTGTTNQQQNYSYPDKKLSSGKYKYRLKQIDYNGNFEFYNLQNDVIIGTPVKFSLSQNYPNPSNPVSRIDYDIPENGNVALIVYDLLGREVKTLVNQKQLSGYYTVTFDGTNFASGIYFYRLITDGCKETRKMLLIK